MNRQIILTPIFMDEPSPKLASLAQPDWIVNQPEHDENSTLIDKLAVTNIALADAVAHTVNNGDMPVSVAGDCVSSIGVMAGLHRAGLNPTLIWFDAHGDFNTFETTPSGFIGGMPLAMLVGRGDQSIMEAVNLAPIEEEQVILTDARDLDPEEGIAVRDSEVIHIRDVAELLENPLPAGDLYVHFDVDVLNPDDAPSHRYATPGGASEEVMRAVFQHIADTGRLRAVSMSAWHAEADTDGKTEAVCLSLLETLIGV